MTHTRTPAGMTGARPSDWLPSLHWIPASLLALFFSPTPHAEPPTALPATNQVQVSIPGNFGDPFGILNDLTGEGIDINMDGIIDILPPCSCRPQTIAVPNGNNFNNGLFDDQIVVASGVSGQIWRLGNASNVLYPSTLFGMFPGTLIPEVGSTGIYALPFVHGEGQAYTAEVYSPSYPGEIFGPVSNTCHYPDPFITGLDEFYCGNAPDVLLSGYATSEFDGGTAYLDIAGESWQIRRVSDNAVFNTNVFSPSTLGNGTYRVRYTVDLNGAAHGQINQTGCGRTAEQEVRVRNTTAMVCQSSLNITLSATTCQVLITPQMLLAGVQLSYNDFEVQVITPTGASLGDIITAPYVGQNLLGVVTDACTGSFCTTSLLVRDVAAPQLQVPADIVLACTQTADTAITGVATATDCSLVTLTYTDQTNESFCGNPRIVIARTWRAQDPWGNVRTGVQQISILRGAQADLRFPEDKTYSCAEYQADPTITAPLADKAGLPNLVDVPTCGIFYSYSDNLLPLCGDPALNFVIMRTWFVIDACGDNLYTTDGLGNDNTQLIRVRDETPPLIQAEPITVGANLAPADNGLPLCASTAMIPLPAVYDDCSTPVLRIITPLGEAAYVNGEDAADGAYIPWPGLMIGTHTIQYEARDACGNVTTIEMPLTVEDVRAPTALCRTQVNVVLQAGGFGLLQAAALDAGSNDDCCLASLGIRLAGNDTAAYASELMLDCNNEIVAVQMRVLDCTGNSETCTTLVNVRDPVPVAIVSAPEDVYLTCQDEAAAYLSADFDAPVFADNCGFVVAFSTSGGLDECGQGSIHRVWVASDHPDNPAAVVMQTIYFEPVQEYGFTLPSDQEASCVPGLSAGVLVQAQGCDNLDVSATDSIISIEGNAACYIIRRTHRILNTCEYDGLSTPTVLPRNDIVADGYAVRADGQRLYQLTADGEIDIAASSGYYVYEQLIYVVDNTPPSVAHEADLVFCAGEAACSGEVSFSFQVSDNCTEDVPVDYLFLLDNNLPVDDTFGAVQMVGGGFYLLEGQYPIGTHALRISAQDACGNTTVHTLPFTVIDCDAPALTCRDTLVLMADEAGNATISPQDLVLEAADNCGSPFFSFMDQDLSDQSRTFSCDNPLSLVPVSVFASDAAGNVNTCTSLVGLAEGDCIRYHDLSGQLRTETGLGLDNATVRLTTEEIYSAQTDMNGLYTFEAIEEGSGYKLTPEKNNGFGNGITTLDLIMITRHILSVEPLNSPYKIIGADANKSGTVTTFDVLLLRRVILGVDTTIVGNTSWRFVPQDYAFTSPLVPFLDNFPESVTIDEFDGDQNINFVAIKVGDMNGSAQTSAEGPPEDRGTGEDLTLSYQDEVLTAGSLAQVHLQPDAATEIAGFQFTLSFDPSLFEWEGLLPSSGLGEQHLGQQSVADGLLSVSWHSLLPGEQPPTLSFQLRAKRDASLAEGLHINDRLAKAEAYQLAGGSQPLIGHVQLSAVPPAAAPTTPPQLHPARPNPFSEYSTLPYHLPRSGEVSFRVWDMLGRLVHQANVQAHAGYNEWRLPASALPQRGVFHCEMYFDGHVLGQRILFEGW